MLNLDSNTLNAVVEQACIDAAQHGRWLVAIGRAAYELEVNPYLERQDGHLLIGSPSGATYAANGVCSCTAYAYGQPCWHRAAARIVRLHDEQVARASWSTTAERAIPEMVAAIEAAFVPARKSAAALRESIAKFNAELFG